MILPYRTVSSGVTLKKQDTALTSEGYLSWDDRADRKVFYTVQLNDNSQYYRKVRSLVIITMTFSAWSFPCNFSCSEKLQIIGFY